MKINKKRKDDGKKRDVYLSKRDICEKVVTRNRKYVVLFKKLNSKQI